MEIFSRRASRERGCSPGCSFCSQMRNRTLTCLVLQRWSACFQPNLLINSNVFFFFYQIFISSLSVAKRFYLVNFSLLLSSVNTAVMLFVLLLCISLWNCVYLRLLSTREDLYISIHKYFNCANSVFIFDGWTFAIENVSLYIEYIWLYMYET